MKRLSAMSNSIPNRSEMAAMEGACGESTAKTGDAKVAAPLATPTPLAHALVAATSLLASYRGAQTVERLSNSSDELAAILTASGVYDLGWRRFLRCTGEDRVRWLNGMVTNSVGGLEENAGCYAFVLNAQGRIQGDLEIYRRTDALWLETDLAQIEALTAFLDRYIIMDDVALELQSEWTAIGIAGPLATQKMEAAGFPVVPPPLHLQEVSWHEHGMVVAAAYSPLVPRYEIWMEQDRVLDVWKALTSADAVPCGSIAVEQLRILEGTPAYSVDISNKDLPQETNQMRAIHFAKGCYLGQEIVERIRSRGNVHRTFSGFVLGDARPTVRTPLLADGNPAGEITSVARISLPGVGEQVLALGSVRREALERNAVFLAGETKATPSKLPFDFVSKAVQP
jgi:folate-binding protein YgfZ